MQASRGHVQCPFTPSGGPNPVRSDDGPGPAPLPSPRGAVLRAALGRCAIALLWLWAGGGPWLCGHVDWINSSIPWLGHV
jgi:hypothetical protein